MSAQLDLLLSGAPRFPRARASDASSSHDAAALVERTGAAATDLRRCLAAIRRFPGSTTAELAKSARIDRHTCGRRMPELQELGLVSRREPDEHAVPCAVSGRRAIRWYP